MQKYIKTVFNIDQLVEYLIDTQDNYLRIHVSDENAINRIDPYTEVNFIDLKETLEEYFK